jgi:antitoxin YefM
MSTTFRIQADELDQGFIDRVKSLFHDKKIAIVVFEEDETDYLASTNANRDHLDRAIANIRESKNLLKPDQKLF